MCDFELFGAVHHFGALNGGHYVALTPIAAAPGQGQNPGQGQGQGQGRWHLFDDARVTPLERPGPALDAQVGEQSRASEQLGASRRAHARSNYLARATR